MTSLMDTKRFPAALFGEHYDQRRSIEEAFKGFKHGLRLEQVTGFSHLVVLQDFATKTLCDNLAALASVVARSIVKLPVHRMISHVHVRTALQATDSGPVALDRPPKPHPALSFKALLRVDRQTRWIAPTRLHRSPQEACCDS